MQIHGLGWTSKYSPPPKKKTSLTTDLRRIQLREHQYHHSRGYAPRISCLSQRERSHPLLCAVSPDTECNYGCLYFTFSVTGSSPTRGLHQGPKQICSRHRARYIPRWSTTATTTTSSLAGIRDGASPRGGSWKGLICIYVCCVRGRKTFCTPLQFRCCACVAMACATTKKIDPYQPPAPCWVSPVLCCLCVLRALCRATGIRQLAVGFEVLASGSVIVGFLLQC